MRRLVLINLGVFLGLCLTTEFISRLVVPTELPQPLVTTAQPSWENTRLSDPLLFWRMRPDIGKLGKRVTNSLGLRGEEIPPKSPDEFRILSLGESTTFGAGLSHEETYSGLLERSLGTVDGKRVRVVNAGVPGYSLFQGVTYLRHRGLDLEPDAVMTYFGFNDMMPVSFRAKRDGERAPDTEGRTDRERFAERRALRNRIFDALLRHSNLARFAAHRPPTRPEEMETAAATERVPQADRRLLYSELIGICRSHGIRLIVVIPWYRDFDGHIALLRKLEVWDDVVLVDIPAKMAPLDSRKAELFRDFAHPNAAGHRLIADALTEKLRAAWGLGTEGEIRRIDDSNAG